MSNVRLWSEDQDQPFTLNGRCVKPAPRTISYAGEVLEVEPRVMAVLLALAQRSGKIVRRQELIDLVWSGAPGADQSLNNAISLLRRALHDVDAENRLIKTAPKQGYKLCGKIDPVRDEANERASSVRTGPFQKWRLAVLGGAFVIISSTVLLLFSQSPSTHQTIPSAATPGPHSIAVLPFDDFSADQEYAYFADGLAEEILHALTQVKSLSVASRTDSFQFRNSRMPIGDIAQRLGVSTILEGSVTREGDRLRVTAQLIAADSNTHLWSSTYDRTVDDALAIQRDIGVNIANALAREITQPERERLANLPSTNADAYEQFLIGKHELRKWTPDGNRRAVHHLESAVKFDPEFAEAHLALGRAYYFAGTHYGWLSPAVAIPKVKASLIHGVSSENLATRAAALSVYGDVLAWSDQDWRGAIAAYERAFELSGSPSLGYGLTNSIVGNHAAAIGIFQNLLEDGGGTSSINAELGIRNNLAWAHFNARRYDDARREAQIVISADETFADGYRVLGRAQLMLEQPDKAIATFSIASKLMSDAPTIKSDLAVALARAGRTAEAVNILQELESADDYVSPPLIAQIYANLGNPDQAFQWLEKGITDGARGVIFLKVNPMYDPIRSDPRYFELLHSLNLAS